MNVFEAVVCGAVQGACEFLPVSSSGHLALLHSLFGFGGGLTFDIFLHLGTLCAVIIAFRRDVLALLIGIRDLIVKAIRGRFCDMFQTDREKLIKAMFFASVPLVFAAFISDAVEKISAYPKAVGAALMINGALLISSEMIRVGAKRCETQSISGSFGTGLFQLAATVPGLSRSGTTIVGAKLFGMSSEEAVRFSFLLSIPAALGANIFGVFHIASSGETIEVVPYIAGTLCAAVSGLLAIGTIKRLAKSGNLRLFGVYCTVIGAVALIMG